MRKYKPPERLGRPPNCRWIYGVPPDPPDLWHSSCLENNRSFTNNLEVGVSNENYTVIRNCVSFPMSGNDASNRHIYFKYPKHQYF